MPVEPVELLDEEELLEDEPLLEPDETVPPTSVLIDITVPVDGRLQRRAVERPLGRVDLDLGRGDAELA